MSAAINIPDTFLSEQAYFILLHALNYLRAAMT